MWYRTHNTHPYPLNFRQYNRITINPLAPVGILRQKTENVQKIFLVTPDHTQLKKPPHARTIWYPTRNKETTNKRKNVRTTKEFKTHVKIHTRLPTKMNIIQNPRTHKRATEKDKLHERCYHALHRTRPHVRQQETYSKMLKDNQKYERTNQNEQSRTQNVQQQTRGRKAVR